MSLRIAVFMVSLLLLAASPALAGKTERVSVDSNGNPTPSGLSDFGSISATGRFAAFDSDADALVPHDTNGVFDVFVHDRSTGKTTRVSVSSSGKQAVGGQSYAPSISANGRFVAFYSGATNLVKNDTNDESDVFVHDRATGKTTRVSVASDGKQGDGGSESAAISANGRFVAFHSSAKNLVDGDTNNSNDVFVHDRKTGKTRRVSVDSSGVQGNNESYYARISAKGRTVVFESNATNLVLGDTNGIKDVFAHDLKTGVTTRMSVDSNGVQPTSGESEKVWISANGRYVAFESSAPDLVLGDTNAKIDVFVHDRKTGVVKRESLDSNGAQVTDSNCRVPTLSRNGRFVLFESRSAQLVPLDTNASTDIFLRDRKTGETSRVSLASNGAQSADPDAYYPAISGNGKFAIFTSNATDLDGSDTNNTGDIFVRNLR